MVDLTADDWWGCYWNVSEEMDIKRHRDIFESMFLRWATQAGVTPDMSTLKLAKDYDDFLTPRVFARARCEWGAWEWRT